MPAVERFDGMAKKAIEALLVESLGVQKPRKCLLYLVLSSFRGILFGFEERDEGPPSRGRS